MICMILQKSGRSFGLSSYFYLLFIFSMYMENINELYHIIGAFDMCAVNYAP